MTKNNETQPNSVSIEKGKTIIAFTNTATPTISDYNGIYVHYGQYPQVRCIINVDANNRYELQQKPQFTLVDGLIVTICFDLGIAESGYLVLS